MRLFSPSINSTSNWIHVLQHTKLYSISGWLLLNSHCLTKTKGSMLSLNTSFRVRHPCLTTTPVKCENELSVLAALIQELVHVVGKRSHPTRTHQNKLCGQNLINKFHLRSLPPTQAPSTSDMSSAPRPQHPPPSPDCMAPLILHFQP